jgi:hypothetical protein
LTPRNEHFRRKSLFLKTVLPEKKPVEKTAFNLPAGFLNKPCGFQALLEIQVADITCFPDCS